MEHPCAKCGANVIDGLPFCPQCKSPQIRVPGFDGETATEDGVNAGEIEGRVTGHVLRQPALQPRGVQWHKALPAAVLGGVVSIAALALPLAVWGPAYAIGGAVAVFVYRLRARNVRVSPGAGAKIGAASAGFGFSILAIITIGTYVYHADDLRKAMADAIAQMSSRGSDPQTAQQALELLKTQEGLGFFVAFGLLMLLVVFVIASSIGGALCASWLRRR
jgi:hypothetical protein